MLAEVRDMESSGILTDPTRRKKAFSSPYIHRLQRRHFFLFDVLPGVGTAVALGLLWVRPVGWIELGLLFAMWLLTGLGVTVGYHRLFTHRAFKTTPAVKAGLAILGSMAGQGSVTSWTGLHRRHHELSDQPGDPHSPNLHGPGLRGRLQGLVHAHFTWMREHEYPNIVHYAPDLVRDQLIMRLDRFYFVWVFLGLAIPSALGGLLHGSWGGMLDGFLWGGVVRMFVLGNIIWSINSFLHSFGTSAFQGREYSRNSAVFSLLTLGESWHNNHHAFPSSPSFGLAWYRLDPGYWMIQVLAWLGLAWELHVPSAEKIQAKLKLARPDKQTD